MSRLRTAWHGVPRAHRKTIPRTLSPLVEQTTVIVTIFFHSISPSTQESHDNTSTHTYVLPLQRYCAYPCIESTTLHKLTQPRNIIISYVYVLQNDFTLLSVCIQLLLYMHVYVCRTASLFCKLSGLLTSYGLYQVVLHEQLSLYCRGSTASFSARMVLTDTDLVRGMGEGVKETCVLFKVHIAIFGW